MKIVINPLSRHAIVNDGTFALVHIRKKRKGPRNVGDFIHKLKFINTKLYLFAPGINASTYKIKMSPIYH